jgi:hypothetical protein
LFELCFALPLLWRRALQVSGKACFLLSKLIGQAAKKNCGSIKPFKMPATGCERIVAEAGWNSKPLSAESRRGVSNCG